MSGLHKTVLTVPIQYQGDQWVYLAKEIRLNFPPFDGLNLEGVAPFEGRVIVRDAVFSVSRDRWQCRCAFVSEMNLTKAQILYKYGPPFGWSESE